MNEKEKGLGKPVTVTNMRVSIPLHDPRSNWKSRTVKEDTLKEMWFKGGCPVSDRVFQTALAEALNYGAGGWLLGTWKKDSGSYVFRGPIDMHHTVYESIQDGKLAFIAIGPHYTVVGARRGVLSGVALPECMSSETFLMNIDGYLIYQIEKGSTSDVIKFLPWAVDNYKKSIKKLGRKIRKQRGKYSLYPETKVITY